MTPTKQLFGKVAIITGASRGIGKSTALTLGAMGANVIVNYQREKSEAEKVCKEIEAIGGTASAIQADVTNLEQVQSMVMQVYKRYKSIDILINNAGITRDNYFIMMTNQEWDDVINVNLHGVFNTMKSVSRIMSGKKNGVIINVGSGAAFVAMPGQTNYSAAKAALLGLTRSAARELATKGVRVINVAPGFFNTDMTKTLSPKFIDETFEVTPLGRWGEPKEISQLISFLSTEAASGFSGHTIVIDGGRGAWEREFGTN